jgi:hypothetical protein
MFLSTRHVLDVVQLTTLSVSENNASIDSLSSANRAWISSCVRVSA